MEKAVNHIYTTRYGLSMTEKQMKKKYANLTSMLGVGWGSASMVGNQKRRNKVGRDQGVLTQQQALRITAELLIRQGCKCWVTGSELIVRGDVDSIRSYKVTRLDNRKGDSVQNCRAVCSWVARAIDSETTGKAGLIRYLGQLDASTNGLTGLDFGVYYRDRHYVECSLAEETRCEAHRVGQQLLDSWPPFFDLPRFPDLSELSFYQLRLLCGYTSRERSGN